MGVDELPRGSKFINLWFDQEVVPKHPDTGESVYPPLSLTAIATPKSEGWVKARLVKLVESTGWRATFTEDYIHKEDRDG